MQVDEVLPLLSYFHSMIHYFVCRADEYDIFKEAVSESEAPGYYDVITNPMDLSTMRSKAEKSEYGEGSEAAAKLYEDMLLMFDNVSCFLIICLRVYFPCTFLILLLYQPFQCFKFNDGHGEVVDEATHVLKVLPLIFAKACQEVMRMSSP